MKKIIYCVFLSLLPVSVVKAQKVDFCSELFEACLKYRLGMEQDDNLTQQRLDTITSLNLSNFGLTDIRDIQHFPSLKTLDLSRNRIIDLSPLTVLENLNDLDLSFNGLKDINPLIFSASGNMTVDVTHNRIEDFSIFQAVTDCMFTFIGTNFQAEASENINIISAFYAEATNEHPILHYSAYSSEGNRAAISFDNSGTFATADALSHEYSENFWDASKDDIATISMAGLRETTLYKAPQLMKVEPGSKVNIDLELQGYHLQFAGAGKGSVSITGSSSLTYEVPNNLSTDCITYFYYEGNVLRGMSMVHITTGNVTSIGNLHEMETETLTAKVVDNNAIHIYCKEQGLASESTLQIFDASGYQLFSQPVDTSNGVDETIQLPVRKKTVLIIRLISGNRTIVTKVF